MRLGNCMMNPRNVDGSIRSNRMEVRKTIRREKRKHRKTNKDDSFDSKAGKELRSEMVINNESSGEDSESGSENSEEFAMVNMDDLVKGATNR